jgi:hypothetical protein
MPGGQVGAFYSVMIARSGNEPMTWTLDSGVLPGGLTLGGATGIVSGVPTTVETQASVVRTTNAVASDTQAISVTIIAAGVGGGSFQSPMGLGLGYGL